MNNTTTNNNMYECIIIYIHIYKWSRSTCKEVATRFLLWPRTWIYSGFHEFFTLTSQLEWERSQIKMDIRRQGLALTLFAICFLKCYFLSVLDSTIPQTLGLLFGSVCSGKIFNPENVISETMYCNGVYGVITKIKRLTKLWRRNKRHVYVWTTYMLFTLPV